jgi:hypothetical protein
VRRQRTDSFVSAREGCVITSNDQYRSGIFSGTVRVLEKDLIADASRSPAMRIDGVLTLAPMIADEMSAPLHKAIVET